LLLNSVVNGLFLPNAVDLADRIRSGDLDTALLKPVDAQFLLTCQRVDWALLPQVLLGGVLVLTAAANLEQPWTALDGLAYILLLGLGMVVLYSCVVLLASAGFLVCCRARCCSTCGSPSWRVVRLPPEPVRGGTACLL